MTKTKIFAASTILFSLVLLTSISAQTFITGQTYYGRNNYIEYKCGNYPLIISGPHAGTINADEMGDRTCGAVDNDVNTHETILALRDSIFAKTGKYPHVIINHLKRIKLDPNREVAEATCGDTIALISYNEYHAFIDNAKSQVVAQYGKGLYNDFHGHGHTIQRIEVGYILSSDDLAQPDASIDSTVYIDKSGIKYLAGIVPMTFSQLIRGQKSLGNFFEDQGYPAVPSPSQPNPGTASYFNGGYSVSTHGSKPGGTIDGVQFEVNYAGIRDTDPNRRAFAGAYAKIMDRFIQVNYFGASDTTAIEDSVVSNGNGNWSSPGTWTGGIPPSSNKNVLIRDGDTVIVDVNTAQCKDIWFGSANSKLAMADGSILNVYGDFSIFSATHNAFSSWVPGAKIRFTGNVNQLLRGWSATGFSTSFKEMIVDKSSMKVATFGSNMKFSVSDSLEIIKGTFELGGTDDFEGRTIDGSPSATSIIIRSGGIFNMVGGGTTTTGSYIRQGANTGVDDSKIGKMTVFGEVDFGNSNTTVRTNLSGIDIESGGVVYIPLSRSVAASSFNPGTITIKNGGLIKSSISTAFWYPNATTPTTVVVNSGGEYYSSAGTTNLPQILTLNTGSSVRYYSTTASTLPVGITTYENLILTGTSAKSLGVNTTVNGTLSIQSTATLNLNSKTLAYGPSATLQYGYSSQADAQTTTDNELPAVGGPPNLTIYNKANVTLHSSRTLEGVVKFSAGSLLTGSNILTLGNSASLSGEAAGSYILGNLATTRAIGKSASTFGGIGVSLGSGADDLGNVTATRTTGSSAIVTINSIQGIARKWSLSSSNPPSSGRDITLSWIATDDNGKDLSSLQIYNSAVGSAWTGFGSTKNATSRSLTFNTNIFGQWTVNSPNLTTSINNSNSNIPKDYCLFQNSPNPFNPSTKIRFSLPYESSVKVLIYNTLGQLVSTIDNSVHEAGNYAINFEGSNLSSGIYFYSLNAKSLSGGKEFHSIRKMILLK